VVIVAGLWYQTFRNFDKRGRGEERTFANVMEAATHVDKEGMIEQLASWKWRLPQGVFPYALVMKRLVDSGNVEVHPLNTLLYTAAYPVPRRFWPEKPDAIGARIVTDVLKLHWKTNWGLGVVGQAYYEGDWVALVAYAALLVFLVRMVDEPLKREPNNPFFISVCAASSLYVVTWLRGDLGVHTTEILECFVWLIAMQLLGAMLTGSRVRAYALDFGSAIIAGQRNLTALMPGASDRSLH
jgi:hypothetical protein